MSRIRSAVASIFRAAFLYSFVLCGCTPIADVGSGVSPKPTSARAGADAAGAGAGAPADPESAGARASQPVIEPQSPCSVEGARSCMDATGRQPLLCMGALWLAQTRCAADQRCDSKPGATQGQCVAAAPECLSRPADDSYCDGNEIRTCVDGEPTTVRACDALQTCRLLKGQPECTCSTGSVDMGDGCQAATSCSTSEGGCDPLTTCNMNGAARVCTACPVGYTGDGVMGCTPQLGALTVLGAALTPAWSPTIYAYQITVPLLRATLQFLPVAPERATIEINGASVASGGAWTSPPLPLGQQTIELVVTAPGGLSSRYNFSVQHVGAQEGYLKAMVPGSGDTLGYSMAIDGDTLVVGAPSEDGAVGGVNGDQSNNEVDESGAAYVFVRSGGVWSQEAYLKADSPSPYDFFGAAVAIEGDTVVVGAARASPFPNGPPSTRGGSAYVFTRSAGVWTRATELKPDDSAAGDMFGYSMAMTKDFIAVGAPWESSGAAHSGAVYVSARTGGGFGPLAKLKPEALDDGQFGWSTAAHGTTIVGGAIAFHPGAITPGPGAAYVWVSGGAGWTVQQKLQAMPANDASTFGFAIGIHGDTIAVGAPFADTIKSTPHGTVSIFDRSGSTWSLTATLKAVTPRDGDYFGTSVGLNSTSLLVGASGDPSLAAGLYADADPTRSDSHQAGSFYLFGRQGADWTRTAYVKASNPAFDYQFGQFSAMSDDTAIVGSIIEASGVGGVNGDGKNTSAPGSGAVYVFR